MNRDWILQTKETRRSFATATWVPLRASQEENTGPARATELGYTSEVFACGSVAFPPQYRVVADALSWSDIGISHAARPYAYIDGHYSPIDEYQYNDKQPIGVELVFEHPQPVIGGTKWLLNPDLVVALRLLKEGSNWVRPEEDFVIVAREVIDSLGKNRLIEIKREFLIDYLAARGLALRISYYRQRVENVVMLAGTEYEDLDSYEEQRDGGRFKLLIQNVEAIFGGSWASFRVWRTDIDEDEDAPVMGPESDKNTNYESSHGGGRELAGVRVEGEFWKNEWVDHQNRSLRIRRDVDEALPTFIVETDGSRLASSELNDEDVGRWLWFRSNVISEFLGHRGFTLNWYTLQTGGLRSTSGYDVHFGLNSADLITVYAHDVARLASWEQHLWAAHNVVPDGKVSSELLDAQVKTQPASTFAVEELLFQAMRMLEIEFRKHYGVGLFTHDINDKLVMQSVNRFFSKDEASLLRLAKEIIRVFSDRLNLKNLRKISSHADRDNLGSNKLLQDILSQVVGEVRARSVMGPIFGAYGMRLGDAHPTGSKIADAIVLAGVDTSRSHLRQGEQLIHNVARSVYLIASSLIAKSTTP